KISELDTPAVAKVAPETIRRILEGEQIKREIYHRRKDGTVFPVEMIARLLELGDRKYIFAFNRDITERRLAEEAIKKYTKDLEESNRIKELFIDIMHHDVLNPLSIASGFIELLKDDETDQQKKVYIENIEKNLTKALDLIENATTYSRLENLESIEMKDIHLEKIIMASIENLVSLASKMDMKIENKICQNMPVRGNAIIIEVFDNLISNAIKYATKGKKIIVEGNDAGDSWIVKLKDFGDGINDVDKIQIFDRFHRMEKRGVKGSGLGLAIAIKIMELHKGRIWVEDNPEGGAVFVVEVPKSGSGN
ncbi:MAG TPA: PAS domain-containing sensor histidine kinase, partial [Candidatus Methanoperedens sp.]